MSGSFMLSKWYKYITLYVPILGPVYTERQPVNTTITLLIVISLKNNGKK